MKLMAYRKKKKNLDILLTLRFCLFAFRVYSRACPFIYTRCLYSRFICLRFAGSLHLFNFSLSLSHARDIYRHIHDRAKTAKPTTPRSSNRLQDDISSDQKDGRESRNVWTTIETKGIEGGRMRPRGCKANNRDGLSCIRETGANVIAISVSRHRWPRRKRRGNGAIYVEQKFERTRQRLGTSGLRQESVREVGVDRSVRRVSLFC